MFADGTPTVLDHQLRCTTRQQDFGNFPGVRQKDVLLNIVRGQFVDEDTNVIKPWSQF